MLSLVRFMCDLYRHSANAVMDKKEREEREQMRERKGLRWCRLCTDDVH